MKTPKTAQSRAKKARRSNPKNRADRDALKKCPSGLAQTLLVIQEHWLQETDRRWAQNPPFSAKEFAEKSNFKDCFELVKGAYPGTKKLPKNWGRAVWDMAVGESALEYYKLRAWAKFTDIRSVGLLLLFSQLVGEERRSKTPQEDCLKWIDGVIRVMEATKKAITNAPSPDAPVFLRQYDGHNTPLPNVGLLKIWHDALHEGPLPSDSLPLPPKPE